MQLSLQRHVLTAALFSFLLLVCCQTKSDNTSQTIDSSSESLHVGLAGDTVQMGQGASLFMTNCNNCHGIFKTDNMLDSVAQRLGKNYFKLYLTRQDSLIKAKDEYALKVKQLFGNHPNNHNFKFSDEQLNAIITYLTKYSS